jgi:predicted alpha/beta-fold hydrolase
MRDAIFSRRDMLWAGGALTVGAAFAEPLKAAAPERSEAGPEPTSWVDSAMPEVTHRMIETNGVRLHVAEQGEGPLIILCHGFPECWYSWRHQLRALAKAGFRAVAPDLRGYGRSDRPEEVEKYTVLHDIGDIVGLVDALDAQQAAVRGRRVSCRDGAPEGCSLNRSGVPAALDPGDRYRCLCRGIQPQRIRHRLELVAQYRP